MSRMRRLRQTTIVLVLAAVLAIWLDTSGTLGGFTVGSVTNPTNTAALARLSIAHSYPNGAGTATCAMPVSATSPATQTCAGSLLPGTVPGTRTDTITNSGTLGPGSTTSTFGLSACGPRQLATSAGSAAPLLPRRSTLLNWTSGTSGKTAADSNPFPGAGSVTFSGGSDYASTAAQVPDPVVTTGLLSNAGAFGVWFKTTAASGGLLSFDTVAQVPGSATGNNAFALYLSGGKIGLRTSAAYTTPLTSGTYNNGAWHFVYATIDQLSVVGLGVTTTARIYLDGSTTPAVQVAPSLGQLLGPPVSPLSSGYWLLGWSQLDGYLTGSESDFVVSTTTAAATSSALYSASTQSAFAAATTPTALWPLNDEGNSVYSGSYPVAGGALNPCSTVNVTRNGTTQSLATTVTTPIQSTIPAPGGSAPYDTGIAAGTTYAANLSFAAGLQIYAPTRFVVSTTSGAWRTVFDWNASGTTSPATNPNVSPTFVIT